MPKRSHATRGRPCMMNRQPARRADADRPDERHLERSRALGFGVAKHEHADADEHEREQRSDVGQVVGLARVADQRPRRHENARKERRHKRDLGLGVKLRRPLGSSPSRAIAKKIRG